MSCLTNICILTVVPYLTMVSCFTIINSLIKVSNLKMVLNHIHKSNFTMITNITIAPNLKIVGASHHPLFFALFFAPASFRPFLTTLQKGRKEARTASFCPFLVALFFAHFTPYRDRDLRHAPDVALLLCHCLLALPVAVAFTHSPPYSPHVVVLFL